MSPAHEAERFQSAVALVAQTATGAEQRRKQQSSGENVRGFQAARQPWEGLAGGRTPTFSDRMLSPEHFFQNLQIRPLRVISHKR